MFSKHARPFSQSGELSQLSQTQPEPRASEAVQQDDEDQMSTRADAIVEDNVQIRLYVESTLKELEKERIKLQNKDKHLDEQIASWTKIHEQQKKKIIHLQGKLEEESELYQNELKYRPALLEKVNHSTNIVRIFEKYRAEANMAQDRITSAIEHMQGQFKASSEKLKRCNVDQLKTKFATEMNDKISKCSALKNDILKSRSVNIKEIQTLSVQLSELIDENKSIQEDINVMEENDKELTANVADLTRERGNLNEEINNMQKQLDEFRDSSNTHIQNLKLEINTEENINSNLQKEHSEKENSYHALVLKEQELENLSTQMKTAVGEKTAYIENLSKEIQEYQKQNTVLKSNISSCEKCLLKHVETKKTNQQLNKSLSDLNEKIKLNKVKLEEKYDCVKKYENQLENGKLKLQSLEESMLKHNEDLEKKQLIKNKLLATLQDNNIKYKEERESTLLVNQNLEIKILDITSNLNKMNSDLKEYKELIEKKNSEVKDIEDSISSCLEKAKKCDEQILLADKELDILSSDCEKDMLYDELAYYEELVESKTPVKHELSCAVEEKANLEKLICEALEKHKNDEELIINEHSSKMLAKGKEAENYSSIMENLILTEQSAIEKIKDEAKTTEKIKLELEEECKRLAQHLNSLKATEAKKRRDVAKIEKQMRAINKEIKFTRQDISDVISTNVPEKSAGIKPVSTQSSQDLLSQSIAEPPEKKIAVASSSKFSLPNLSQSSTSKKWVESVPYEEDEYEFSEV